jgi:hypothetical protein
MCVIFVLWIYKCVWFSYCGYMNGCDFRTVDIWMGVIFVLWIYEWMWFSYCGYMNVCDFRTVDIWMGVIFVLWVYEWVWFSYYGYMNGYDFRSVDIWMGVIFILWISYMNGSDFHTMDIWIGVIFILWIYEWVWFSYCGYMNGCAWLSYCGYMNGCDFHTVDIWMGTHSYIHSTKIIPIHSMHLNKDHTMDCMVSTVLEVFLHWLYLHPFCRLPKKVEAHCSRLQNATFPYFSSSSQSLIPVIFFLHILEFVSKIKFTQILQKKFIKIGWKIKTFKFWKLIFGCFQSSLSGKPKKIKKICPYTANSSQHNQFK